MTAAALIAEASQLGITLWAEGRALRFQPKSAMTPKLAAKLTAGKQEVLQLLRQKTASLVVTPDEAAFWLACLRDAGCRIELDRGVPSIQWAGGLDTPGRRRDWEANLAVIRVVLEAQKEFARFEHVQEPVAPLRQNISDRAIIADPVVFCPSCGRVPVLRELRQMTGGPCYPCWETEGRS